METVPNNPDPIVAEAVEALRAFGRDLSRERAASLLVMWSRFGSLDIRQFGQVIDHFPPAEVTAAFNRLAYKAERGRLSEAEIAAIRARAEESGR